MLKLSAALLLALSLASTACAATPEALDLHAYAGEYALADGRILSITDDTGQLSAQLSKRGPTMRNARLGETRRVVLKPTGPARFTSTTTTPLQITFAPDGRGEIAQVHLTEQGRAVEGLAQR